MKKHSASTAPENLLQAFSGADYCVLLDAGTCVLRVGRRHPALDQALAAQSWAIVTACNPRGRPATDRVNREQHRRLLETIAERGWRSFEAVNRDPGGCWPDEPGVMLVDVDDGTLDTLAQRFNQAAVLHGHPQQPARLRLYGPGWPKPLPGWARQAN